MPSRPARAAVVAIARGLEMLALAVTQPRQRVVERGVRLREPGDRAQADVDAALVEDLAQLGRPDRARRLEAHHQRPPLASAALAAVGRRLVLLRLLPVCRLRSALRRARRSGRGLVRRRGGARGGALPEPAQPQQHAEGGERQHGAQRERTIEWLDQPRRQQHDRRGDAGEVAQEQRQPEQDRHDGRLHQRRPKLRA